MAQALTVDQMRSLLALVMASDRNGVINLLQLNGIDVGTNSTNKTITIAFIKAIKDSESFREQTTAYLENWINTQKQNFLGKKNSKGGQQPPIGHFYDGINFLGHHKNSKGGQQPPVGHLTDDVENFIGDKPKAVKLFGGQQTPVGKFTGNFNCDGTQDFVKQPRDIMDFVSDPHSAMDFVSQTGSDKLHFVDNSKMLDLVNLKKKKKAKASKQVAYNPSSNPHTGDEMFIGDIREPVAIKRNFVNQPRDLMDFVNQPQDLMNYAGSPRKMQGGFLKAIGDADDPNSPGYYGSDPIDGSDGPIANPINIGGIAIENPDTTPIVTTISPSTAPITLAQVTMTPAQVAAANQQAQAQGITPTSTTTPAASTSFLGGLFSASNVSSILKTGLNAYSTNLTASANATSEQNALALEQYKLAQAQQAGVNASISTWPAWATVVIAVAALGGIVLVVRKMNKNRKAKAAAAGS